MAKSKAKPQNFGELHPGFDAKGYQAVNFIERLTVEQGGKTVLLKLRPWQAEIILKVFGQQNQNGQRLIKTLFLGLPRGQGKTTLIAAVVLLYLFLMGRGQQVFSASCNMEQARLIFDFACAMINRDPALSHRLKINKSKCQIFNPANGCIFTALSTDVQGAKFGKGATCCIFDEIHTFDHHAELLFDALTKSFGKGGQDWLTVYITHPGPRKDGFGKREWDNAVAIRDGLKQDPTYLPILYAIKPEELNKWGDETLWRRVNPALGDFLSLDLLRQEYREALTSPEKEWSFKTYRLCAWLDQKLVRWLDINDYDKCVKTLDLEQLKGLPCFAAIDGSTKWDLTVIALCWVDQKGRRLSHLLPPQRNLRA